MPNVHNIESRIDSASSCDSSKAFSTKPKSIIKSALKQPSKKYTMKSAMKPGTESAHISPATSIDSLATGQIADFDVNQVKTLPRAMKSGRKYTQRPSEYSSDTHTPNVSPIPNTDVSPKSSMYTRRQSMAIDISPNVIAKLESQQATPQPDKTVFAKLSDFPPSQYRNSRRRKSTLVGARTSMAQKRASIAMIRENRLAELAEEGKYQYNEERQISKIHHNSRSPNITHGLSLKDHDYSDDMIYTSPKYAADERHDSKSSSGKIKKYKKPKKDTVSHIPMSESSLDLTQKILNHKKRKRSISIPLITPYTDDDSDDR